MDPTPPVNNFGRILRNTVRELEVERYKEGSIPEKKRTKHTPKIFSLISDTDGDDSEPSDLVLRSITGKKRLQPRIKVRQQHKPLRDTKIWCGGFAETKIRSTVSSRKS